MRVHWLTSPQEAENVSLLSFSAVPPVEKVMEDNGPSCPKLPRALSHRLKTEGLPRAPQSLDQVSKGGSSFLAHHCWLCWLGPKPPDSPCPAGLSPQSSWVT